MMKLIIDIPKEFESDYNGDLFKDFFSRVLCDIQQNGTICGNYEKEIAEMFLKAFDESKKMDNNGWIPCSERLPDEYGEYLCCDKYGEYIIGYPIARVSSDDFYVETEHEIMNDCIAWMPLPKISKGLWYEKK